MAKHHRYFYLHGPSLKRVYLLTHLCAHKIRKLINALPHFVTHFFIQLIFMYACWESEVTSVFPSLSLWEAQRELVGTRDGVESSQGHGGG